MVFKRTSSCDESRLEMLLFGDEDSDEFRRLAEHVDGCQACQTRLTDLAADARSWTDIRELLAEFDSDSPSFAAPSPTAFMPLPAQEAVAQPHCPQRLDFLSPPSHPEMLGRLGRYEIERVIGTGGMGVVLKAFDTELNRPVAIKVLAPHVSHSAAARQRFAREGRAAAAVVHEHVVAIHNVESEGEVPFLVMQYVAGESLQARVERQGPLGTHEMLRIASQAAAGLAAAHEQGLVHRDMKPANLLLETGVERALLTDFGLARAMDDASLTHTGIVAGTPHYMSPEQADGRMVDQRSDLFSLGSVLYFMAAGHPPFRAERPMAVLHRICHDRHRSLRDIRADIPPPLSAIIDRLLEKKPTRRPGSAADLQQALARLLSDLQQGRQRRMWPDLRRHRRLLAVAATVAVLTGTYVGGRLWFGQRVTDPPEVAVPSAPPVAVDGGLSRDAVSALVSFGPAAESSFAAETAHINAEIDRLESARPEHAAFLRHAHAPWLGELTDVQHDLSRLESTSFPDLVPQGDTR
jgi:hypothetical protein